MTRDRGDLPPYHQTSSWPPSAAGTPQHAHQPYSGQPMGNGNGIADLRERVRAIETTIPLLKEMAIDRFSTQAKRMDGVDGRLAAGDRRMEALDSRISATEQAVAPLPGMEARVAQIERRSRTWRDGLYYAMAALIVALVLARKLTVEQAYMLLKLILPLSPG